MKTIINGNNIEILKTLDSDSIDSIVTDPPYGINFLGKDWDANTGALETYEECLRVLKPGGHLLAFSAARTYHHLAITLEQAGFEIRDQLMWLYSSGFPKAQDIGKAIDKRAGKKGRLGPLYTPGQGNPKITSCEVCGAGNGVLKANKCQEEQCPFREIAKPADNKWAGWKTALKPAHEPICMARKPFKGSTIDNVLEHGVGALNIDATRIDSETLTYPSNGMNRLEFNQNKPNKWEGETVTNSQGRYPSNVIGEVEGYQKYFYCPKVSRKERNIEGTNNHPTVKPVALMEYLIKLVTPKGGTVLDPFMGSGSTGMAACGLGYNFIGMELDKSYCNIAEKRIEGWCKDNNNFSNLFEDCN